MIVLMRKVLAILRSWYVCFSAEVGIIWVIILHNEVQIKAKQDVDHKPSTSSLVHLTIIESVL